MAQHTIQEASDTLDAELDKRGIFDAYALLGYIIGFLTARHPDSVVDAIRAHQERERA